MLRFGSGTEGETRLHGVRHEERCSALSLLCVGHRVQRNESA
jgi:hypothetical protein